MKELTMSRVERWPNSKSEPEELMWLVKYFVYLHGCVFFGLPLSPSLELYHTNLRTGGFNDTDSQSKFCLVQCFTS